MLAKPFRTFPSYQQAAAYLGKDKRSIRRYEGVLFGIDKSLPSLQAILLPCKVCGTMCKSQHCRHGYCPTCSQAGEGKRGQGRIISERYRGENNPNYVDGSTKQTFRHTPKGKHWVTEVLARDVACRCCGSRIIIHAHHVLPVALFPQFCLDTDNGITLCGHHHIELHRLQLDLQLLPILYASRSDALPLHEALCHQPEFQALRQLPYKTFQKQHLAQVVPKNYQRQILHLHPEFAQQVLGLGASKSVSPE